MNELDQIIAVGACTRTGTLAAPRVGIMPAYGADVELQPVADVTSRRTEVWHCVRMPEQGSGDTTQQPAPTPAEPPTMTPVEPQKIEIIPLEPKRIIKRSDKPLSAEKRNGGGSER